MKYVTFSSLMYIQLSIIARTVVVKRIQHKSFASRDTIIQHIQHRAVLVTAKQQQRRIARLPSSTAMQQHCNDRVKSIQQPAVKYLAVRTLMRNLWQVLTFPHHRFTE